MVLSHCNLKPQLQEKNYLKIFYAHHGVSPAFCMLLFMPLFQPNFDTRMRFRKSCTKLVFLEAMYSLACVTIALHLWSSQ